MPNQQICTPVNTCNNTTTSMSVSLVLRQGSHCIAVVGLELTTQTKMASTVVTLLSLPLPLPLGYLNDRCEPAQLTPFTGICNIPYGSMNRDHHMSPVETSQICHWRNSKCKALAKFLWTLKFKFHIMLTCQEYYSFVFDRILYPIDHSFQLLLK